MPTTHDEHERDDGTVPRTPEGGRGVLHTPTDAEARPADPNTLPALLLADEREVAGALALATESATLTYAELGRAARALAAGLIAAGVAAGDRVAIWLPNGPDWLAAHWAATLCGAIVVPLNTRYRAAEARYILAQSGAAALVMQGAFGRTDYLAALKEMLTDGAWPELRVVVVRPMAESILPEPAITWETALRLGETTAGEVEARARAVAPDDVHILMYTSGTTGYPKGAMLTHEGLIHSAGHHFREWGLQPGDAVLVPNPFSHIMGLIYGVLMPAIARVVPVTLPAFDTERVLGLIQRYHPVMMTGTPTHFQMLAEHPTLAGYDVSSLRFGMAGGAGTTPETIQRITERLGIEALVNGLGMSEAGSVAHTVPSDPPAIHATTVGRPMPWLQTRLVDPNTGADTAPGEPGELWIHGPGVMKGYFRDAAATAAALTPDGWLRTGDLLRLGDDGCLRFVGRLKEMFTVGGFNVYPAEVERVLAQHPAVAECMVVGVPDERLGEVPFAFIRLAPSATWTPEELTAFCGERLAGYKAPRTFHVVESFPTLASGKRERRPLVDFARQIATGEARQLANGAWEMQAPRPDAGAG
jgi:HIP---CoA ligase